ncbi:MAG: alkaline phosphatase, partial [Bacteroidota bacterium]
MKNYLKLMFPVFLVLTCFSCDKIDDFLGDGSDDDQPTDDHPVETFVDFNFANTFDVDGEDSAEISAYDPATHRLFVTNGALDEVTVFDISDIHSPTRIGAVNCPNPGSPNSVAVKNGILAVALSAPNAQENGFVEFFDTATLDEIGSAQVGALPDMVAFTPNGKYVLSANEGEPNDDYSIDPPGSVSIVEVATQQTTTLDFTAFNGQETALEAEGFRIFGPNADLATDVEPEFLTISNDGKTAWVALQENNGLAVVNLKTFQIESILPLGFKDFSIPGNEIDPSNEDGKKELRSVPVFGIYQPDALAYYSVDGID